MCCPNCKAEFRPGFTECNDCGVPLVEELPEVVEEAISNPVVADENVACLVCGCADFETRSTILDKRGMTFLGLEWLNRSATLYICRNCGHIMWFAR